MNQSLQGKRILITRDKKQAAPFAEGIEKAGGEPVMSDLLAIDCMCDDKNEETLQDVGQYDWVFFTSANGVKCFFDKYNDVSEDKLESIRVGVVGSATEAALNTYGYEADFMPHIFNAKTMVKEFMDQYPTHESVLLVQGKRSRMELGDAFIAEGRPFSRVTLYETKTNQASREPLNNILTERPPDFITFMSPSVVEAFVALREKPFHEHQPVIVCIGMTTQRSALNMGFQNTIVPETFTIEGMIEAMCDYIEAEAGGGR